MIESEEKRKSLVDILERWAKNCKIEDRLRDGDIHGLVSCILGEFYHTHLACGHQVPNDYQATVIEFDEPFVDDSGFHTGRCTMNCCTDCADYFMKNAPNCVDITEQYKLPESIEWYLHHDTKVAVFSKMKGKHRGWCLCYQCSRFKPDSEDNCLIARENFHMCESNHLVTPVWECANFLDKEVL